MNRLFGSDIDDNGLSEDAWNLIEPAIRDVVSRMIGRHNAPAMFKQNFLEMSERTSDTPRHDPNQLIDNVSDRIRALLFPEITAYETNDIQSTKTLGGH